MSQSRIYGSIFHKANKQKDSHPDATGSFTVTREFLEELNRAPKNADGCCVVEFAGWTKQGPKAGKYLSGNLVVASDNSQAFVPKGRGGQAPQKQELEDDDLPF